MTATNVEIRNGRLIDPRHGVDGKASLFVAAGRVAGVGSPPAGWRAGRIIDAAGCVVCPGLIDLAARLREPGFEYMATLESEMNAAIAGGVTSLACPPDTDPSLDEPGLVEMLKYRARSLNQAHVYPVGALTVGLKGENITEMGELAEAGCVAFSHADAPLADTQVLRRALQYAATFGYAVWLR
ncbi:MAG TPA: dihydroorotase, partial [Casimicrobiaceae bacterium]|nr:dihydroorotase [Casimicrobiaceae bacterium]